MAKHFTKPHTLSTTVAFFLLAILVITGVVSMAPQLASEFEAATSPTAEHFSELYFTDHLALPKEVDVGEVYTVPVTVTSHEGTPKTYTYQVTVSADGSPPEQTTDSFTLQDTQTKQFPISFLPTTPNTTYLINVTLQHNNQTIQFRAQS